MTFPFGLLGGLGFFMRGAVGGYAAPPNPAEENASPHLAGGGVSWAILALVVAVLLAAAAKLFPKPLPGRKTPPLPRDQPAGTVRFKNRSQHIT